jgi:carboxypeptidase family protein
MQGLARALSFTLAMQLSWIVPAAAQQITLNGTVTGGNGQPRPSVLVQLEGPAQYAALTNVQGKFTMTRVVPGSYVVRIRQGDNVETQQHTVSADTTALALRVRW